MKQLRSTFILFTLLSVITLFAQDKKQSKEYPVIKFEQTTHDFGTFSAADPIQTCVFKFYNVGKEKLVINYVHTSCGCTAADYTKTPISPGASGEIKVTYDATGKMPGRFKKSIQVFSNCKEEFARIYITGSMSELVKENK